MNNSSHKVLAALHDDMNEGWVWANSYSFASRTIVCIENLRNGKKVYCEYLKIDSNFEKKYNQGSRYHITTEPTIILNNWYRKHLDCSETNEIYKLEVSESTNQLQKIVAQFRYCIGHPQVVVRLATWLGFLSVFLGAIGVIF